MVELRPPTFDVTSSFGVLELQFEEAAWRHDCSMVPECAEGAGMDAFRDGVGDLDIRGEVLLSPGVIFAEAVAHALTGEAVLDIIKPAVKMRRVELEQSNNCNAEGDSWPRDNWPRNNSPLTKVRSGHGRMRYWIYGRAGQILRNGWKRTRKKVRKKVRAPSPLWRISKVDRRRVVERKGPRKSDVLKMDALMLRPGQVDVGHHGRMEEKKSIIDVGRMEVLSAGDANRYEVRRQQSEDPDLSMMVKFGEKDHRPAWSEIAGGCPALKVCWTQWDGLSIKEGCQKRIWESFDGESKQSLVVVPKIGITEILRRCHGAASGTHLGINGTLAKVRERFHYAGYRQAVAGWCRGCEQCRTARGPAKRRRESMQMNNGEAAIWRVAVDHKTKARFDVQANDGGQRTKGLSRKFQPEWEGPYKVINRVNDVIYRIQRGLRGKPKVVHLERLALYRGGGLDPVRDEQVWAEGSVTN